MMQDLSSFKMPEGFRGRSAFIVQLWWIVEATLFRHSLRRADGFRRWLLRLFGARVGKKVIIRSTVRITYPWKITIGDHSWIGDDVELYSLGEIIIGSNTVISQHSYLCGGDHDYRLPDFPIRSRTIRVEDEAWVACHVFIAPGVTIGHGAVIGARSAVFEDMPAKMVCVGSPCRPIKPRLPEPVLKFVESAA